MLAAPETTKPAPLPAAPLAGSRLQSLDVLRGATIAAMMLVNNPGNWDAVYAPLEHAPWHGWTFTDLVFPFFLWIVGMAIPLSTARRLERGQTRAELLRHAAIRAALLFLLGLFLNFFSYLIDVTLWREGFSAWCAQVATHLRIPGVLQRIGICYFCACGLVLFTGLRGQVAALLGLLGGYWLFMMLVPVPGYGAGILDKEGNFAAYIDNLVLNGRSIGTHVWQTSRNVGPGRAREYLAGDWHVPLRCAGGTIAPGQA
jgi:predicted acyltransferase